MQKTNKTVGLIIVFFILSMSVFCQVTKVQYQLRYNTQDTAYEMYIVIQEGNAVNSKDRVQFNSQISLLVPTASSVKFKEFFMPLAKNDQYQGTKPLQWQANIPVVSPISKPEHDFIGLTPLLSSGAHWYNNLTQGDSVRLFSFRIVPMPSCLSDVRLFENGVDPGSSAPGMQGGDFSNAFTMVNPTNQIYSGNVAPKNIPQQIALFYPSNTYKIGDLLTLPTINHARWVSNYPHIAAIKDAQSAIGVGHGLATFSIIDSSGLSCGTTPAQYFVGPTIFDAGPDTTVCGVSKISVQAKGGDDGLWNALPTNTALVGVENLGQGKANLTFNNQPGIFKFRYGNVTGGYDTIQITVSQKPVISLSQGFVCTDRIIHGLSNETGKWYTTNPAIGMIHINTGEITGIAPGIVSFFFVSEKSGCSTSSPNVTVSQTPAVAISEDTLKIGAQSQLSPSSGGSWNSSNESIAHITPSGLVTALYPGKTNLTFFQVNNNLCPSFPINLTVTDGQLVLNGPSVMCKGENAILSPRPSDAKWSSSVPGVLSVDENGVITGHSAGIATIFLSSIQGEGSITVKVSSINDDIDITNASMCVGSTLTLPQIKDYKWKANNSVVVIDGQVLTTSMSGNTILSIVNADGCQKEVMNLTIMKLPEVYVSDRELCLGEEVSIAINDNVSGFWNSNYTQWLDMKEGKAIAIGEGKFSLSFTSIEGCVSSPINIEVFKRSEGSFMTNDTVMVGGSITLFPAMPWISSNLAVAFTDKNNVVKGLDVGKAEFIFVDEHGCASLPLTIHVVEYLPCLANHDSIIQESNTITTTSGALKYEWFSCDELIKYANENSNQFTPINNGQYFAKIYWENCVSITPCFSFVLSATKNIDDVVKVYPNPFSEVLRLSNAEGVIEVNILNASGVKLLTTKTTEINTKDLPVGVYLLEITTDIEKTTKKVIKM